MLTASSLDFCIIHLVCNLSNLGEICVGCFIFLSLLLLEVMKICSFSNEIEGEGELGARPFGSRAAGLTLCLTAVTIDTDTVLCCFSTTEDALEERSVSFWAESLFHSKTSCYGWGFLASCLQAPVGPAEMSFASALPGLLSLLF